MRAFFRIIALFSLICGLSMKAQTWTLCDKWVDCGNGVQLLDPYYSEGVSFEWHGGSKNGKAHGQGTAIKYKNGIKEHTYVGEYQNGIRQGKGTYTHADGTVRKGTFINGQMTGKGTMDSEDGQHYEGDFINYRMHGQGKVTYANGAHFEGTVVCDII